VLNEHQFEGFDVSRWTKPETAEDQCYEASEAFVKHGGGRVARYTNPVKADRLPDWADPHDMTEDGEVGHAVVHRAGHVIDLTARQFWPSAPHPLVEPVAKYRKRFQRFEGLD
jgi:hypothetical protein